MAHILALDIGTKRTGVAYLDESVGIPLPLESIAHGNDRELVQAVQALVTGRGVDRLIVGLPRLPGGEEGKQASLVRKTVGALERATGLTVTFIDERYSTPRTTERDPNAEAAWNILSSLGSPQTPREEHPF